MLNLAPTYAAMSKSIAVDGCALRQQRPTHVMTVASPASPTAGTAYIQSMTYKYRLPLRTDRVPEESAQ